jgi:hypothetical protein
MQGKKGRTPHEIQCCAKTCLRKIGESVRRPRTRFAAVARGGNLRAAVDLRP